MPQFESVEPPGPSAETRDDGTVVISPNQDPTPDLSGLSQGEDQ